MEAENIVFADAELAGKTLGEMYPDAKAIELVEHGYDNIVGLVDDAYAVRFPRNIAAYKRGQYEKSVLSALTNLKTVTIPHVLDEKTNPPCLVTSFVHGRHLSAVALTELPPEAQRNLATKVATFAYEIHSSLPVEEARKFRVTLGLDTLAEEPWDVYFENTLVKAALPTASQDQIAKHHFAVWSELNTTEGQVVLHDDLHAGNMLFEDDELAGVLDFGDTNIGTPEQELRQLYWISDIAAQAGIDAYNRLSGKHLNLEAIKTWAIMQELAAYASHITSKDTGHPSFERACRNLNRWFPEAAWGVAK